MLKRSGEIEIEGGVIEWLQAKSNDEQEELKVRFRDARQRAKAVNFGLLYGMQDRRLHSYGVTDYSLVWTLEEAAAARAAWFELYPEVGFWQVFTAYACSRKLDVNEVLLWNKYSGEVERSKFGARLYTTTSLMGRPFVILGDLNEAYSYQGQGSGADILALAITYLPDHLRDALVFLMHDEIILYVPEDEVQRYQTDLEEVMIRAGNEVLGGLVPCQVESKHGKKWRK